MNPSLAQQAQTANAQGQAAYQSDLSNANNYQGQYNTDVGQSQAANQAVQQQAQYMQGAGSGANVYNQQLGQLTQQYDPNIQNQLSGANQSLFQLNGALNGANQQFNTPGGVGAYGLSAPALAGYENSVLQPLQQGVGNANTQVGTLNNQLGTLMGGASQATSAQVQTEQQVAGSLQNVYTNALAQANQAASQMQYYGTLAQQQGGLNATNAANYAAAQESLTKAQADMAQASYLISQTTGQNLLNQQTQAAINAAASKTASNNASNTGGRVATLLQPTMNGISLQGGSSPQTTSNPLTLQGASSSLQGSAPNLQ